MARAPGEDDIVLTFSGEFRTRSDTEVLLHCYLEWGADCERRLNGMFAFGIWDGRRQELLVARDRLGVKPLYYAPRPDGVLFGSEPKTVLAHPEFRAEIDAEGLAELFSQVGTGTPGHAVYRGLAEVRPGTLVVIGRGGIRESAYWRLEAREHAADRYAQALAEVPRLAGESPEDRRIREILYLGLTRWLPFLLDRKDRLSMATGLEIRVPFTDHRRKSIYPGAADPAYERAIDAQLRRLLTQPDAPLFDLISREALAAAYAADPRLAGLMSVQPSSTSPVAFLLDVNRWLERSGVTIR